ncbi:MAG: glycerol-3-phosphate dehydrogenase, partial [Rhodospirillales bacterium]|nr:glycerol-3-phosphate dehydrogenase [Rhodospirillales bacterium]
MKISVLGGGNGSYATAVDLSEQGHEVWLWRRGGGSIPDASEKMEITVTDNKGTRNVSIHNVGTDLAAAIVGAELVVIPLPATAHYDLASRLAPLLEDDQVVFLPPGTLGGLILASAMKKIGNKATTAFAETGTLPYLTRKQSEDSLTISVRATRLPTGVFPASQSDHALSVIRRVFPAVEPLKNIL